MPKFRKSIDELVDNTDRWLFVLTNLSRLQSYPEKLKSKNFQKLFSEAEIANYNMDDFLAYQNSLNDYRNNKACLETARAEGREEEKKKNEAEKLDIARKLLQNGVSKEIVASSLGIDITLLR